MTTTELIILGAAGNAHDIIDVVEACNAVSPGTWRIAGVLDDERIALGDLPVLGKLADAARLRQTGRMFINAIGSDQSYRLRRSLIASTGLARSDFAMLVHPQAAVSSHASLGPGTCVCAHACIAGAVCVGDHVTVCPGVIIGHDAVIGDHSILAPGCCVSGFVNVGESCYVGARAVIRPRVTLGEGVLVGMGAVVVRPVREQTTVVGNPARPLLRSEIARAQVGQPS